MYYKLALASVLMLATVAIQIEATMIVLRAVRRSGGAVLAVIRRSHVNRLGMVVLVMLAGHLIQVLLWAVTYVLIDAIQGFEKAMYFSMVTFTTLGYGDVTLEPGWRLLGSFEAAVGIIMFGWTTAIVVAVVHKAYLDTRDSRDRTSIAD